MKKQATRNQPLLERFSQVITKWLGTPTSIIAHSFLFVMIFSLKFFGFPFEDIMLSLTTIVSLEAIYLALFIQMTVNRTSESIEDVEEDIGEIQEDVQEIGGDFQEMQADVEELETDVEELSDDIEKISESQATEEGQETKSIEAIENNMSRIISEIESLKKDLRSLQLKQ